MSHKRSGRPRNAALDEAILGAAREILSSDGMSGLTFAGVAKRAETTRPAVYRRYESIEELAIAAIGRIARLGAPEPSGDLYADLVAELTSFRDGITSIDGLALTAITLDAATAEDIKTAYRSSVVAPRRARLAAIFARAHAAGHITAAAGEQEILVSMCTGSWYAYHVAGAQPPEEWPSETAALVVRAAS